MNVPAFTPPAPAPARAAAVAAVCERMAAHEAAVAKRTAAAAAAWHAELAALRTTAPRVPLRAPGVLIRETSAAAAEQARARAYYDRMDAHELYRQRRAQGRAHDDRAAAAAAAAAALVEVHRVSDIVKLPHRQRRHAAGHAPVVSAEEPIIPTADTALTGAPAARVAAAPAAVSGAAAAAGIADRSPAREDAPVGGVQRPSLIDAVARIVQRWVDGMQQGKRRDEAEEQQPGGAAVGAAAQVLAVLFSLGRQ